MSFLVRSRTLLSVDDRTHYDYHDEETHANFSNNPDADFSNNSVFSDEMKDSIEKLLASEDSTLIRSKLEALINNNADMRKNEYNTKNINEVNVVELNEKDMNEGKWHSIQKDEI